MTRKQEEKVTAPVWFFKGDVRSQEVKITGPGDVGPVSGKEYETYGETDVDGQPTVVKTTPHAGYWFFPRGR